MTFPYVNNNFLFGYESKCEYHRPQVNGTKAMHAFTMPCGSVVMRLVALALILM